MALRKIYEFEGEAFVATPFGQVSLGQQKTAFSAYCKITNINTNLSNANITLECSGENYKILNQYPVVFSVEDDAPNFVRQAYLHLKTLPEFSGATDC
jgi:hypothetical protein